MFKAISSRENGFGRTGVAAEAFFDEEPPRAAPVGLHSRRALRLSANVQEAASALKSAAESRKSAGAAG
jgi:hypothetical protein